MMASPLGRRPDGFELLSACSTPHDKMPFVQISRAKDGRALKDVELAEQLTKFLDAKFWK